MKNFIKYTFTALIYVSMTMFIGCSSDDNGPGPDPDPDPDPVLGNILMFISKEDAYYSEYKITLEALQAAGYTVDVRSSASGTANVYTFSGDLDDNANQTPGDLYSDFTWQFQSFFGVAWNADWNTTPATVPLDGRIQDVSSMSSYDALVIPGGRGAVDYRVDDDYAAQGDVTAADVQAAAEKLNDLAVEALIAGKPVVALCHGASIPAFFKVPGTSTSILEGGEATGFPLPEPGVQDTETTLTGLGVTPRMGDVVTISSPSNDLNDNGGGDYKIITSRDWYTQSVAYATRTLLNVLDSYPSKAQRESNIDVLILHGGAVNAGDCDPSNRDNDVPCNHGGGAELPADYTDLNNLLAANSPNDSYTMTVDEINLFNETPSQSDLAQYDVVIFFKHWSSGVTTALQNALIDYADDGGGVLALHHAVYNEPEGGLNKNLLVDELFGIESGVGVDISAAALRNYNLFSVNYGHFVSTYGITLAGDNLSLSAPGEWAGSIPFTGSSLSFSDYHNFGLYEEIYNNVIITPGNTFGRETGQLTPLFSTDLGGVSDTVRHAPGFVRLFNPSGDSSIGRVVFFQPGERQESYTIGNRFSQVIRNAVIWSAWGN